jgi:hypothetical protein
LHKNIKRSRAEYRPAIHAAMNLKYLKPENHDVYYISICFKTEVFVLYDFVCEAKLIALG